MTIVNIHYAKTHLSRLINDTLAGKLVLIAKADVPVVKLSVYNKKLSPRQGGQLSGLIRISRNFDAPLPNELLDQSIEDY